MKGERRRKDDKEGVAEKDVVQIALDQRAADREDVSVRRFLIIARYFPSNGKPACSQATIPPSRFQTLVNPKPTSASAAILLIRSLRQ